MSLLLGLFGGVLYSEILGYWLHRLLHSEKIAWLSRGHMVHHLRDYSPVGNMRPSDTYLSGARDRSSVAGVGFEWLLPIALALALTLLPLHWLGLSAWDMTLFSASAIAWGTFMFACVHDGMHVRAFWMDRNPLLRGWFRRARRLHDVHHLCLHPSGRMHRNFGICFYGLDRLFGTYAQKAIRPDEATLARTFERYASILTCPGERQT